jgi:Domain of unknown function DUF29
MVANLPSTPQHQQTLYETDYVHWIETTLAFLRAQDYSQVDWENLLDEIEDLSRRERQSLESNLVILLLHLLKWQLLKWQNQSESRSSSWKGSIVEHRRRIRKSIKQSPSLNLYLQDRFAEAYADAVEQAMAETDLPRGAFPLECSYSIAQVLDADFLPMDIN